MQASTHNVLVTLPSSDVFVLNTLTAAEAIVSADLADCLTPHAHHPPPPGAPVDPLAHDGFLVPDEYAESHSRLNARRRQRDDTTELRVTVLLTLACNMACAYCYQRAGTSRPSRHTHMSVATAHAVATWLDHQLHRIRPERLVLTLFGGEPLLNIPALDVLARRSAQLSRQHGVDLATSLITNGLALTPPLVTYLRPLGLRAIKVTLDGDRATHDRQRTGPGGTPTYDTIVSNLCAVADIVSTSVGGNFDTASADRFGLLLDDLRQRGLAPRLCDVSFKPIVRRTSGDAQASLSPHHHCDTSGLDTQWLTRMRRMTRAAGFRTTDGLRMGPCDLTRRHSHTVAPDGTCMACPGFTGTLAKPVGHVNDTSGLDRRFIDDLAGLTRPASCEACTFEPVCGGGCGVAAALSSRPDIPVCHRASLVAAIEDRAAEAAMSEGV